jgi:hypothetical protein
MQHVDTLHRGDGFDVVQALDCLDHANQEAIVVELRNASSNRHRTVVEMRITAADRALADGSELAGIDRALCLLRGVDIRIDDAHGAVIQ